MVNRVVVFELWCTNGVEIISEQAHKETGNCTVIIMKRLKCRLAEKHSVDVYIPVFLKNSPLCM
jgi:hypothetical protein